MNWRFALPLRSFGRVLALILLLGGMLLPISAHAAQVEPGMATPQSVASDPGSLGAMLGQLPDLPLAQSQVMVTYANVALQLDVLGIAPVQASDSVASKQDWAEVLFHFALPGNAAGKWAAPEWRQAFGFDLYQIEQAVSYAPPPPTVLTALRGSFDPAELRAAWARSGYQPIDLGAGEAYAIREDFEIDLADPTSRLAMASLNVIGLADNGTLVFGSTRDGVAGALAAAEGQGPSLEQSPDVAPLVAAAPPDLVSAMIVPGAELQFTPDMAGLMLNEESPEAFATRVAAEERDARRLPPVATALLGLTAGTFPGEAAATPVADQGPTARQGQVVAILAMVGSAAATTGAAVIEERLATGRTPAAMGAERGDRPWAELYPERTVTAVAGVSAVQVMLIPAPGVPPNLLHTLIFTRVPGFLAWEW
jgi:hypothetical protein